MICEEESDDLNRIRKENESCERRLTWRKLINIDLAFIAAIKIPKDSS